MSSVLREAMANAARTRLQAVVQPRNFEADDQVSTRTLAGQIATLERQLADRDSTIAELRASLAAAEERATQHERSAAEHRAAAESHRQRADLADRRAEQFHSNAVAAAEAAQREREGRLIAESKPAPERPPPEIIRVEVPVPVPAPAQPQREFTDLNFVVAGRDPNGAITHIRVTKA
jgi:chromosome segregation ATPase